MSMKSKDIIVCCDDDRMFLAFIFGEKKICLCQSEEKLKLKKIKIVQYIWLNKDSYHKINDRSTCSARYVIADVDVNYS